jgi:hypothetical protein
MDRNEVTDARPGAEERERMLMDYVAGKISWRELRRRGLRTTPKCWAVSARSACDRRSPKWKALAGALGKGAGTC